MHWNAICVPLSKQKGHAAKKLLTPGCCTERKDAHSASERRILFLAMKFTAFILLVACLQVSAGGNAQKVTLSLTNASWEKVFHEIKKQTGYNFFYKVNDLLQAGKVTVNVNDSPLEEALDICFRNQPLTYTIIEKTVLIKKQSKENQNADDEINMPPPPIDVRGRVLNENGEPVIVSVMIKGTNAGTSTNAEGYFELKGVNDNAILVITASNIESREIAVRGRTDLSVISVKMKVAPLDEVQVIAYGVTSQRISTSNVNTIKAIEIERQPINNPLLALAGRVPGLIISQNTGFSGSGINLIVQGPNSIFNGTDPLYVVDGVPYPSQLMTNDGTILGISNSGGSYSSAGNPLAFINPMDIESISVLKDADATSIYGSRAANGAIIINTKKGVPGSTKVSFDFQQGFGKVTRKLDLLSTSEYLEMREEALANDGLIPSDDPNDYANYAPDLTLFDQNRNIDWQKELIGGTAKYTNLNSSVSGGDDNTQYTIGATYHRETTVFPIEFDDKKTSIHLNLNTNSLNKKFLLQFSTSYLMDNNHLPSYDITEKAMRLIPNAPDLYNDDGSLNWEQNENGVSQLMNPLGPLQVKYNVDATNIVSNLLMKYQLFPKFYVSSSFGYNKLGTKETLMSPLSQYPPEESYWQRATSFRENTIKSWIIEPQLNYTLPIGTGRFEVLIGMTLQSKDEYGKTVSGYDYTSDDYKLMEDINAAGYLSKGETTSSEYKYNAIFGRINYNISNKYIINLSARRDGSSRFGSANQLNNFGGIGMAWVFSQESFFDPVKKIFSFGKLRLSYGTTGNDQIDNYGYLSLYQRSFADIPYRGSIAYNPARLSNPYLQWEETRKLNIGFDLGFFKDKIMITTNFYHNRSSNQLLTSTIPSYTGFSLLMRNLPATVQNSGVEFSVSSQNIRRNDFTWTSSFNFTIPRNKLVKYENFESSPDRFRYVIGKSINIIRLYRFAGVNQNTGEYEFLDAIGKATTTPSLTDQTIHLDLTPRFYGGLKNTFSWKGFTLDFLFSFFKQYGTNYSFGSYPGYNYGSLANQPKYVLDRWQKPGDNARIQRFNSNGAIFPSIQYMMSSDAVYGDASYIRLKNLYFSWQLPSRYLENFKIRTLRLFAQGQNLMTITNYKGLDPETMSSKALPPLRVVTFGIKLDL